MPESASPPSYIKRPLTEPYGLKVGSMFKRSKTQERSKMRLALAYYYCLDVIIRHPRRNIGKSVSIAQSSASLMSNC